MLITHKELFKNKDDLISREDVIHALLSAFSIKEWSGDCHKLNKQEVEAFLNVLNVPKFKGVVLHEDEIPVGNAEDLRGKQFDKLTVLYRVKEKGSNKTFWRCKCSCGAIVDKRTDALKSNIHNACPECMKNFTRVNLIGKRFGRLLVIKEGGKDKYGRMKWECLCDCGNTTIVSSTHLIEGSTHSCGCISYSLGEEKISNILNKNNVQFEMQKTFENCIYKKPVRFDFYINNQYLLEYDGSQHFFAKEKSKWNTEENLKITQERDIFKNQWCKDNNIPLIRIPYTKFDTLCIEDLMLETTQFRVV